MSDERDAVGDRTSPGLGAPLGSLETGLLEPRLRGTTGPGEAGGPASPPGRRAPGARPRRNRAVVLVVLAMLAPFLLAGGWFYLQLSPLGSPGRAVQVEIQPGWDTGQIADALAAHSVIGSAFAFKAWATVTGSTHFEAGTYGLNEHLGVRDAIRALDAGPRIASAADVKLLLPPGLTLSQIADRVGRLPGKSRDRFLTAAAGGTVRSKYMAPGVTSLEGFLAPDTYFIGPDESEEAILRRLVAQFDRVADSMGLGTTTTGLTPYQSVVLASLIEREAKLAEDAPLIAEVVLNRLHDGMLLQIDATLCYAKGGCTSAPTDADKLVDSPYNTYRNEGLPPTPIASVGRTSLDAAVHPATGTYLYYVLIDASGKHAFATTLSEHERNVALARSKGLL